MISYQAIKPSFIIINEFNNLFEPRPKVQHFDFKGSQKSSRKVALNVLNKPKHCDSAYFVVSGGVDILTIR